MNLQTKIRLCSVHMVPAFLYDTDKQHMLQLAADMSIHSVNDASAICCVFSVRITNDEVRRRTLSRSSLLGYFYLVTLTNRSITGSFACPPSLQPATPAGRPRWNWLRTVKIDLRRHNNFGLNRAWQRSRTVKMASTRVTGASCTWRRCR